MTKALWVLVIFVVPCRRPGATREERRYNAAIMSVLFLLIGAKLIGDAISGFSG